MPRLIIFASGMALMAACSKTPDAVPGNSLVSAGAPADKPAAAPAASDATAPRTGEPVATSGDRQKAPAGGPSVRTAASEPTTNPVKRMLGLGPEYREVTLPVGTVLPVDLGTTVGSDISRVEQAVEGTLRSAVRSNGVEVLPAGTAVSGYVTAATRPGKVKGRGFIAMRFTRIDTPGAGSTQMSTATISRTAPATKEKDALKIIAPAAAGAIIGRIAGDKGDARKGAVIGGAAGTGYVLATRGKDVQMAKGSDLAVRLTAPLKVRVAVAK